MSRCARLPRLNHQTKAELSPDLCRTIDVALKALRKASRQIQLTSVPTAYELQFLERIYYKNKNVQRPTMAWRKVIELRRVGYRWKEVDLVTVVDSFRLTFYDVTATTVPGSKPLQNAWTCAPSLKHVVATIRQLQTVKQLLAKVVDVCHATYAALAVYINNRGFFSLTVSLMAITSRLCHLARDHAVGCAAAIDAALEIVETMEPGASQKYSLVPRMPNRIATTEADEDGMTLATVELDLGTKVARVQAQDPTPAKSTLDGQAPPILFFEDPEDEVVEVMGLKVLDGVAVPAIEIPTRSLHTKLPLSAAVAESRPSLAPTRERPAKKRKKAKAKRNEIDDIFGF